MVFKPKVKKEDSEYGERTAEFIKKLSDRTGQEEAVLLEKFTQVFNTKAKAADERGLKLTQERLETKCRGYLQSKYRRSAGVNLTTMIGLFLGAGSTRNINEKRYNDAVKMYESDPTEAVEQGLTDEDGTPLDNKPEFNNGTRNRNYGKPLPKENYLRTAVGACHPKTGGDPLPFVLTISGKHAHPDTALVIPIGTPTAFNCIVKSDDGSPEYVLSTSKFTTIVKVDEAFPDMETIISAVFSGKIKELDELNEIADDIRENNKWNEYVIVQCFASIIDPEPNETTGSRRLIIDDSSLEMTDEEGNTIYGTTCWIPEHINLDFPEDSEIVVVGRPLRSKKKDPNTKEPTGELNDASIETYGILVLDTDVVDTDEVSKEEGKEW